ncbi:MAG TPA: serine hydrolase domain-containing protein [Acidobacteriota bacterium]|nr:serine hydrolase domain-containing protein [Acidobacteriota bacterium]
MFTLKTLRPYLLLSLVLLSRMAAASPPWTAQEAEEEALAIAREVLQQNRLPGLAVTVLRQGEPVFSQGLGYADLELKVKATPHTLFRIGSLSKLITVAALARLQEQGLIEWDDTPQKFVHFPDKGHPITLRQLASHTSGIRHYIAGDPRGCGPITGPDGQLRLQGWDTLQDALPLFAESDLVLEPGSGYQYSTFAYTLLGAVMEKVAQKPFLEVISEQVFAPLKMEHSTTDRNIPLIENRSDFYVIHPQSGQVGNAPCNDSSYKWPGGGLLSSSSELAAFAAAHLEPGFLRAETLQSVFAPQPNAADRDYRVGLGWRIGQDEQGRTIYHHGGAIMGGRAFLLAYPEEQVVVVMLANTFARFGRPEALRLAALYLP